MSNKNSTQDSESTNIDAAPDIAKVKQIAAKSPDSFLQYLREIQKFPLLSAEEEYECGMRFKKTGDKEAAKMLVQSHLRLVVKMAPKFRNYGLPITDHATPLRPHSPHP